MAGEIGLDGLTLDSTLENVKISKLEQGNKTSLDILKELCEFFYSYITSQDEKLIFLKKANLRADSYRLLTLDNLVISISKKDSKYKIYNGVQCSWYNKTTKKNELICIGQKPYLTQKSLHNQQLSELLLRSKYEQIKEKELIELIIYPQLYLGIEVFIEIPEHTINYQNFKCIYCIQEVQHKFDDHKLTTHILAYKVL